MPPEFCAFPTRRIFGTHPAAQYTGQTHDVIMRSMQNAYVIHAAPMTDEQAFVELGRVMVYAMDPLRREWFHLHAYGVYWPLGPSAFGKTEASKTTGIGGYPFNDA